ncbi:CHAP domain-containing protein [Psychroserpens sp. NJDZ02]|nr:CHAP domain-containing protein [Psychroserpens sp. NJDZ02]
MKLKSRLLFFIFLMLIIAVGFFVSKKVNVNMTKIVGQKLDSLNGVYVFYNGGVDNNSGRHLSKRGYNYGLKYQCVEFVKRYYYEALKHEMPNTYGHAKDFFNPDLIDGALNRDRNLIQFKNNSKTRPKCDDLLVFSSSLFNNYGHVAIVSKVLDNAIEIIQQNPGPFSPSRVVFELKKENGLFVIKKDRVLGWLRKQ